MRFSLKQTFFSFFLFVSVLLPAQVVINEYSCSNINTATDNFGNYEDWVELYNPSGTAANINGYYLSDDAANPTKWKIVSASVPANGHLLIYASGRNVTSGILHTKFKLTQCQPEQIVFSDASGTILESYILAPAQMDHSRGRSTDGASTWSVFVNPTPGTANTNAYLEYAARPVMGIAPGFYAAAQSVAITAAGAGISIYYTTDGSTPTTTSTIYTGAVNIASTTVLRAAAFSSNTSVPPSFVESNTYFINSSHTIPVVSVFGDQLMTLMNGTFSYPETGLEYFDAAGNFKTESYGESDKHGNDSWFYNQRGIDFSSIDEYGYNYTLKEQFFPSKTRNEFQHIILKAAANDNYPAETGGAHVRDSYVHTLSQQANLHMDERTSLYCIMYVNGQYWGVYDLREKVDDKDFTDFYYSQNTPNVQMLKTWGATWSAYGGTQAQTDWNTIKNYILSNNMAVTANYNYVTGIYNEKSLVDYFVLNSYVVCSDWLNWNTEWWRGIDATGNHKKWGYCLWDEDATFGHYINYTGVPSQNPTAKVCNPENLGDPGGEGHVPILNALLNNPTFKQYYVSRFIDLSNTHFNCTYMIHVLDSMISVIQPEMAKHCALWGGSVSGWQNNVTTMRNWINSRCQNLSTGMKSCYNLTGPYHVAYDVYPAGAGTIDINSITPANYVFGGAYYGNIDILLRAQGNAGYIFDHWGKNSASNTITPSLTDSSATLKINQTDSVVAYFKVIGDTTPVVPPPIPQALFVPNAFSPNGDGENELYFIYGDISEMELKVYDRWGQLIFHTKDQSVGWDGTCNEVFFGGKGKPMETGIYIFKLTGKLLNGDRVHRTGNISLLR